MFFALVIDQCNIAVAAIRDMMTGRTFQAQGKSPAVLKKNDLLFSGQGLIQRRKQNRTKMTFHLFQAGGFLDVGNLHFRQKDIAEAFAECHQLIFPMF